MERDQDKTKQRSGLKTTFFFLCPYPSSPMREDAFPPDVVIYSVLQLVVTTLTFWRLTWRLYRARGGAIVLLAGARRLIREAIFIKARILRSDLQESL